MCIFYLLHELTNFNSDIPNGKRNSRIFILGVILYCLIYILIINLWDKNYFSQNICDAIFWAGLILVLSDISIMGYIYRNYYGRNIINEMESVNDEWIWDDLTHKYYQTKNILKIDKNNSILANNKNNLTKEDKYLSFVKTQTNLQNNLNNTNILNDSLIKNNIIVDNITKKTENLKSEESIKYFKPKESINSLESSKSKKSKKSSKSSKSLKS